MAQKTIFQLSILFIFLLQPGCIVSMSSLQSARTMEPLDFSVVVAGGSQVEHKSGSGEELSSEEGGSSDGIAEAGLRIGLIRRLDLGVKSTFLGSNTYDLKYMLWGVDSTFAFSLNVGRGKGATKIQTKNSTNSLVNSDVKFTDTFYALLFTYDYSKDLSFHFSPRYLSREYEEESSVFGFGVSFVDDPKVNFSGFAIGFNYSWFLWEGTFFSQEGNSDTYFAQSMIGVIVQSGELTGHNFTEKKRKKNLQKRRKRTLE